MTDDYAGWSLADLKSAAAAVDASTLDREASTLRSGAQRLDIVVRQFDSALARLADNWTGTAASAAATNARATIATASDTSTIATSVDSSVTDYAQTVRSTQHEVAAIPDEHFSWGRALAGGGWAGPVGIGVAALGQHQEAERHRAHAVDLVAELDAKGRAHAEATRAQPWAAGIDLFEPPTPLPATDASHTSTPRTGQPTHAPARSGPASYADESSPTHTGTGHEVATRAHAAPHRHHARPSTAHDTAMEGQPVRVASATLPAVPARHGALGTRDVRGAAPADVGADAGPPATGTTRAASTERAAVDLTMTGPVEHAGFRAHEQDGSKRAPSASEPTPVRGSHETIVRGEPGPLPAAQRPLGAAPATNPGYPLGGAGRRRDDEDELRERPEYLIESDDIWGDGRTAAPPVLG